MQSSVLFLHKKLNHTHIKALITYLDLQYNIIVRTFSFFFTITDVKKYMNKLKIK